jgi:DNA-binding MarR family transcriptional regulator
MARKKAIPENDTIPIDSPGQKRLPPLLRRAWYGLNQAFRRRISHIGITPDQFTILRWLIEDESLGLTQRQLGELMSSDPNTITSLLTRMEIADLIRRKPHETDRRSKRIRIRPAGRKAYQRGRQVAIELQAEIMAILPLDRREEFLATLESVADACRDAVDAS